MGGGKELRCLGRGSRERFSGNNKIVIVIVAMAVSMIDNCSYFSALCMVCCPLLGRQPRPVPTSGQTTNSLSLLLLPPLSPLPSSLLLLLSLLRSPPLLAPHLEMGRETNSSMSSRASQYLLLFMIIGALWAYCLWILNYFPPTARFFVQIVRGQ